MDTIRLVGIDVGTTNCGIGIIETDPIDLNIVNIETSKMTLVNDTDRVYNRLVYRLMDLYLGLKDLLIDVDPIAVYLEYAFINRLRPGAYGPLSQARGVIENCILNVNMKWLTTNEIIFGGFPPSIIKNAVGAKGGANKVSVLEAVLNIKEISKHIDLTELTNDEVDGIAIAYTLLTEIRRNPAYLL